MGLLFPGGAGSGFMGQWVLSGHVTHYPLLREKKYHEEMSQQEWAGSGVGWLVSSLALWGRT